MLRGRPTKYRKKFCPRLIALMKEGHSLQFAAAEFEVNQDTIFEWLKKHPDFTEAYKRGKMLQLAWWEKAGKAIALGVKNEKYDSRRANPTIFVWMTKNLLNWNDKQEIVSINKNVNTEVKISEMVKNPEILKELIELEDRFRNSKPSE